jgi:homopolymeric O-antigen transport system ATP-binding protein
MSDAAIQFDHVWKKFKKGESFDSLRDLIPAVTRRLFSRRSADELAAKEFWALKDASFEVRRGEALGVIGPNGAGKSTILKLLSKILRPNKGAIRVQGRISSLIEIGAGFHPDLTGRENVYLNGAILGMTRDEISKKFDEIVEFSGIGDFIDTPVKRYSSGMYARLGFSVAAHVNPEVLLVDEVLSVGDMKFQEKCLQKMLSFARGGHTVVFVSHHLAAVSTLCPRTALIMKGELDSIGPTSEVLMRYISSVNSGELTAAGDHIISNVRLTDGDGQVVDKFSPGQKARLDFALKDSTPVGECTLGFIIRRATDGLVVSDYNLPMDSLARSSNGLGQGQCRVIFDTNLLRGAYMVMFHVFHRPTGAYLERIDPAALFTVDEELSWSGVAHLSPALTTLTAPEKIE